MRGLDVMNNEKTLSEAEIRIRGIEALNEALGPSVALKFLGMLHREPTDYVEISRRLYQGQSVDEIFDRARSTGQDDADAGGDP